MIRDMWIGAAALMLLGQACIAEQQSLDHTGFRAIEVREGVSLEVQMADEYEVSVEAADGDFTHFRVREFLPWLAVDRHTRWFIFPNWRRDAYTMRVNTPEMNGLKALDSATATFTGDAGERLFAEAADRGVVTLNDVTAKQLTLVGNRDGAIVATGTCETLTIRARGAVIDASGLDCASVVVNENDADVMLSPNAVVVDEHEGS